MRKEMIRKTNKLYGEINTRAETNKQHRNIQVTPQLEYDSLSLSELKTSFSIRLQDEHE